MSLLSLFFAMFALLSLSGVFGAPSCVNELHSSADVNGMAPQQPDLWAYLTGSLSLYASGWDIHVFDFIKPASLTPPSTSSVSSADIEAYLSAHNTARAAHGARALTWNDELSRKAQQWADRCVFQHSHGSLGPYGENLAAGSGGNYKIHDAVQSWVNEAPEYDPNNPKPSHFTQVVWKSTTEVGCAVQKCKGIFAPKFGLADYYVCEYSPPGNVIGRFPHNVQK